MKIENLEKLKEANINPKYLLEVRKLLQSSREELRERTLCALNENINHAKLNSPFYRERLRNNKIPQKIESFEQVTKFLFTTKNDLRSAYPFGFLAIPKSKIIRYGESTGTTGSPTSSFMSRDDWERGNIWTSLSYLNFFSPEDMIFIAIPYELAFSGIDVDKAFWNIGATVVAVGTLNMICPWERVVRMMKVLRPSTLVCTPTRAARLYDMFLEKEYEPAEVNLKMLFYIGETCSFSKLGKIAKLWGLRLVTAYGTTETNSLSLPCQYGAQHLTEDRFYFEVIDPEKNTPMKEGERGELILTTLFSEAMPLIRYRTGDIVSVSSASCFCGVPFRTIQHYGRYDERIVVKGNIVLKFDLEEAIVSTEGAGYYYGFSVEDNRLNIMVEVVGENKQQVLDAVRKNVLRQCGIDAVVNEVNKTLICKAMDRMSKPGSVSISQIRSVMDG